MKGLGLRLLKICELAKNAVRLADVGCDHGKVLDYLIKNNNLNFVVASDISAPSVKKAQTLLEKQNKVSFSVRVGDGFSTLTQDDNLDTVIVAGMGGLEIINILSATNIKVPNIILQPQNNVVKLRRYLTEHSFTIVNDLVVSEKRMFYTILKVVPGTQNLTEQQIKYGVNVLNPSLEQINYLNFIKNEYAKRLNMVNEQEKLRLQNEIDEINFIIKGKEIK